MRVLQVQMWGAGIFEARFCVVCGKVGGGKGGRVIQRIMT